MNEKKLNRIKKKLADGKKLSKAEQAILRYNDPELAFQAEQSGQAKKQAIASVFNRNQSRAIKELNISIGPDNIAYRDQQVLPRRGDKPAVYEKRVITFEELDLLGREVKQLQRDRRTDAIDELRGFAKGKGTSRHGKDIERGFLKTAKQWVATTASNLKGYINHLKEVINTDKMSIGTLFFDKFNRWLERLTRVVDIAEINDYNRTSSTKIDSYDVINILKGEGVITDQDLEGLDLGYEPSVKPEIDGAPEGTYRI